MVLNILYSATPKVKFSFNLTSDDSKNSWVDTNIELGMYRSRCVGVWSTLNKSEESKFLEITRSLKNGLAIPWLRTTAVKESYPIP